MCPRPFGRERLRPAGLFMPRARPCGRARLCSAPTTPYAARETFQARATRARATLFRAHDHACACDSGPWCGAWCAASAIRLAPWVDHLPARVSARRSARATRSTTGAMGEGAASEPLPGAIQDAVAAAIEDGATMDEIVACVRARGGDRSPLIPRARRCARARPAEGRWAARMDGLICLQRETDRFAEEWVRTREPGAEGRSALIAIETLRTLALSTMADLSQRTEPVPTEDLARLALALHRIESRRPAPRRARAGDGRCRRARRAGRARGQYDACRTGRNRPPGSRGARLPWAHRPAAAGIRVGRRLSRGLSMSLRRTPRPSRLRPTGRPMCWTRARRRMCWTRAGRGMPT